MGSSFTDEEKRFLLAEMIKVGNIDVLPLVDFVKEHQADHKWLKMHLPAGRNMQQCLQAAELMFDKPMPAPNLKRKATMSDLLDNPTKKRALAPAIDTKPAEPLFSVFRASASPASLQAHLATAPHHVPIQPRPMNANGYVPSPPQIQPAPLQDPPQKKRRGRPPRAQNRNLRPMLPQHLAPLAPHPASPIQLLPSGTPPRDTSSPGTPTPAYSAISTSSAVQTESGKANRRGRPPAGDKEPRVVVEGALEQFRKTKPLATPIKPHWPLSNAHMSERSGLPNPQPTNVLPPITFRDSPDPPSPLKKDRQAPLAT